MIYGSVCLKVIMERRQGNNLSTVSHSQISTSIMLNRLCCPPSLSCFMYKCEEGMRSFMILVFTTTVCSVKSNQKEPLAEALYTI